MQVMVGQAIAIVVVGLCMDCVKSSSNIQPTMPGQLPGGAVMLGQRG